MSLIHPLLISDKLLNVECHSLESHKQPTKAWVGLYFKPYIISNCQLKLGLFLYFKPYIISNSQLKLGLVCILNLILNETGN